MVKTLSLILILSLVFGTSVASAASDEASYYGGTVSAFKDARKEIKGRLVTRDETSLEFAYSKNQVVKIPYASFIDMEYGQKSGRRVGAAASTILLGTNRATVPYVEKAEPLSNIRLYG